MRRQMLALLHVREFAKEAVFVEPCKAVVLPDVVCPHCGAVADLDVCRDAASSAPGDTWRCGSCQTPFESDMIEGRLLERLSAAVAGYQLQDLACKRCRLVSPGGLRTLCEQCGEALAHTVPPSALQSELSILRSIATFHSLPLLADAALFYLEGPAHHDDHALH